MWQHWAHTKTTQHISSILLSFLGGPIPRIGYLVHLGVYALALALVAWPARTFIWTSPDLLENSYRELFLIPFVVFIGIGFLSTYLKATSGCGVKWYWAIAIGFFFPICILLITVEYQQAIYNYGSGLSEILLYIAISICLGFPLLSRGAGGKRFTIEDITLNRLTAGIPKVAAIIAIGVVVPTSIFAGFFQDGVWVGRQKFDYRLYVSQMEKRAQGNFIATCADLSGVSLYSYAGPGKGFIRDGFENSKVGILISKDQSVDIIWQSTSGEISFKNDGYQISTGGMQLTGTSGSFELDPNVVRFIVTANKTNFQQDEHGAVHTFVFTRARPNEIIPIWDVVMTAAKSRPKFDFLLKSEPHAMANLALGKCRVGQEGKL